MHFSSLEKVVVPEKDLPGNFSRFLQTFSLNVGYFIRFVSLFNAHLGS